MSEITPALTREEWEEGELVASMYEGIVFVDGQPQIGRSTITRVQSMALVNHLLSDDDPRKITRSMVNAISEAADLEMDAADSCDEPPHSQYHALRAAALALAALLPPEDL